MAALKLPPSKPRLSSDKVLQIARVVGVDLKKHKLVVVAIRGYYRNTMGKQGTNDIGIYDDAIFLVTENVCAAFNANTDPSSEKVGRAHLAPGTYYAHKFSNHNGSKTSYPAICQRLGDVTVTRLLKDGSRMSETGRFGINIHKGGNTTTSSEGCLTIPPTQWDGFYQLAKSEAIRLYGADWNKVVVPLVLIENAGQF